VMASGFKLFFLHPICRNNCFKIFVEEVKMDRNETWKVCDGGVLAILIFGTPCLCSLVAPPEFVLLPIWPELAEKVALGHLIYLTGRAEILQTGAPLISNKISALRMCSFVTGVLYPCLGPLFF
jgi:hypothetical protein